MEINKKLTLLNHGIKTTDSETFLELKSAKKSMENMEENITDQVETLKSKFTSQFSKLEDKIEAYEDSIDVFNGDIESLRGDLSEQFSNFQSGIIEQFTEASIRYNEFMIPKIWVSLASLRDGDRVSDGLNLGLYREDGTERQRPVYKQVDGFYRLLWTADSRLVLNVTLPLVVFFYDYFCRWVLVSLDKSEEEEVVVSANPRVPHLSGKKWEVATHKVNVVHEVVKIISILPIMTH